MSKRKSVHCDTEEMAGAAKQIKLADNYEDLLTGVDFDEFEEEFTSSEEIGESQGSANIVTELLHGIDFDCSYTIDDHREDLLDLTTWKRCIIEDCKRDTKRHDLIISGRQDKNELDDSNGNEKMICRLQHSWSQCRVEPGDIVSIIAVWKAKEESYCVTSDDGFIVVRPDLLVSGTTVVGGLFCMRKTILADRFKGIEAGIKIMTVGTVVHELFQNVLRKNLTTRAQIQAESDKMLSDGGLAYTLYASSMDSAEARVEFNAFLDKIYDFVQQYMLDGKPDKKENFTGKIESIQDIEENVWLPHFGLKGKIDVSVKVNHRQKNGRLESKSKLMPLELKTGNASFSAEHTGQLIIYQTMMSEIGQTNVDSGLLLYLKDGIMREVKGKRHEKRDLIILRNEISYYLAKQYETFNKLGERSKETDNMNFEELQTELLRISNIPELPEPINRANACSKCPYSILCSVYLTQDANTMTELSSKHAMREIAPLVTAHLTDAHIHYFCHWVGLMVLEDQDSRKTNPMKSLWTETPECRQLKGRAICNLSLNPNVAAGSNDEYLHEFNVSDMDLTNSSFETGSYLIVSTAKRYNVAAGRAVSIEKNAIKLILERNLLDHYAKERFVIDKYESQTSVTFNMSNLGALLDNSEAAERLRSIVIDRMEPTYAKSLPAKIKTEGKRILSDLNSVQKSAVVKALLVNEYLLLKGLPGTGKTQTLVALIRLLVLMNKSVLITSHTHSAIDNVLLRLKNHDENVKFMRLGSSSRIHKELYEHSEGFLTRNCKSPDELTAIYAQYSVVAVTCLGSGHPLLTQKVFDVCLVDESTQVLQSTVLRPLFSTNKIILVGDPDQLPPIIRSPMAKKLGADESLFARLDSPNATVSLTLQYRMNKTITKLANGLTYRGQLKCANADVENATLKLKLKTKFKWLQKVLSPHIDQAVLFVNTGHVYDLNKQTIEGIVSQLKDDKIINKQMASNVKNEKNYINYCELAVILNILDELKAVGMSGEKIGIIAPYALQVDLLKGFVAKHFDSTIEVNTVDQYQGRDKEIIIYSCTRTKSQSESTTNGSKNSKNGEILEDQRRLTVAITRAKHKLLMIGDFISLESYRPFKCLIDSMSKMNKFNLVDGQLGFNWEEVLSVLNKA